MAEPTVIYEPVIDTIEQLTGQQKERYWGLGGAE
jgi:hypothetical protein